MGREGHLIQERTEVSDQIFNRFDQANASNGGEVNGNDGNEARPACNKTDSMTKYTIESNKEYRVSNHPPEGHWEAILTSVYRDVNHRGNIMAVFVWDFLKTDNPGVMYRIYRRYNLRYPSTLSTDLRTWTAKSYKYYQSQEADGKIRPEIFQGMQADLDIILGAPNEGYAEPFRLVNGVYPRGTLIPVMREGYDDNEQHQLAA